MKITIPLALVWFSKENDNLVDQEMICIDEDLALKLVKADLSYYKNFVDSHELDEEKTTSLGLDIIYRVSTLFSMFLFTQSMFCSY